jgi:hypothetical protein
MIAGPCSRRRRHNRQRGSAMLVTLIIIGALLAGAAVLVSLQLASNRSTDLTRSGMSALYCAEAGLAAARPVVAASYGQWGTALQDSSSGTFTEPSWIASAIDHDLDVPGGGAVDFDIYIFDNDDEPSANDRAVDSDLSVYIVSTCRKYPDTQVQVRELVLYNGGTQPYDWQAGGGTGVNNVTVAPP